MFQEYNADYARDAFEELATAPDAEKDSYSVSVDDGFKLPPLMIAFRYVNNPSNSRLQEEVAKACIVGKKVTILKNGAEVGSFILNGQSDTFDAFPVLIENPIGFSRLMNSAQAFVLKKFTPSPKNTANPGQAAASKIPSSSGA
jgi:hypothetical protein